MEIVKIKYVSRCEMGVCPNKANYAIRAKRLGIRNEIHICLDCLKELTKQGAKLIKSEKAKLKEAKKVLV